MKAAFIPEVNDELDTQNFEKFEEVYYVFMLMDIEEFIYFLLPPVSYSFCSTNDV